MRLILLSSLCVAAVGCPDKKPLEPVAPKPLVASVLGMTVSLPEGAVADPDTAGSVAGQSTAFGAGNVDTRAWKLPGRQVFKLALTTAELATPQDAKGATAKDAFELVLREAMNATDKMNVKTLSMKPQLLERGLTYDWTMQADQARVITRGLLVYDPDRGIVNSTAQCSGLPDDLPLCEKAIAGVTFETPAKALKTGETVN